MLVGKEGVADAAASRWKSYHPIWFLLFLSWTFLSIDRSITGPVVAWMIDRDVGFVASAQFPYALGGVIGSMFFAGYMLTQFPSGRIGDSLGHRAMIVLSLLWSGAATLASGAAKSLTGFVAMRVVTGLGEGAYYSNDRAVVCDSTPANMRSLGLGLVFTGLALGMTLAFVLTPKILDAGEDWLGADAWSLPFLIFSVPTILLGIYMWRRFEVPRTALFRCAKKLMIWSIGFLAALLCIYLLTTSLGLGYSYQAAGVILVALALIAVIYWRFGAESQAVRDPRLLVLYVSAIPLLYTLWFFGFWSLTLISESSSIGVSSAALYAGLFGLANGLGYPLGGKLGDLVGVSGRPMSYILLCAGVVISTCAIAWLVAAGAGAAQMGVALFVMGVVFASAQTLHMTIAGDMAPPGQRGQTFGMWNLVAEIGAVLAPALSGLLRDATGGWTAAILLDAMLLSISAVLVLYLWTSKAKGSTNGPPTTI